MVSCGQCRRGRASGQHTHLLQAHRLGEYASRVLLLQLVQHGAQQHREWGQPQLQRHLLDLHLEDKGVQRGQAQVAFLSQDCPALTLGPQPIQVPYLNPNSWRPRSRHLTNGATQTPTRYQPGSRLPWPQVSQTPHGCHCPCPTPGVLQGDNVPRPYSCLQPRAQDGPHLLPLELLTLAQELNQQACALQVVPQPLPVLQLLFGGLNLLVVLSL